MLFFSFQSSKSRSRSRSRGRSERSPSRSRRSSRSRASAAESQVASPKPATPKKNSARSSKKSTASTESRDSEVKETKVINAVSTRLESEKTVENNEAKTKISHTQTIKTQKVTVSESTENAPRVSMRLREKRGEVEQCDLKAIPMEAKPTKQRRFVLAGPWFPVILVLAIPFISVYLTLMCKKVS